MLVDVIKDDGAVFWHHEAACNLKLYFLLNTCANLQTIQDVKKSIYRMVMSLRRMDRALAKKHNSFFMGLRSTRKNQGGKKLHGIA